MNSLKKDEKDLDDTKKAQETVTGQKSTQADVPQDKGKQTAAKEQEVKTTTRVSTKGPYAALVAFENTSSPREVRHSNYSYYTPNALSIFESVRVAEQMLVSNIKIDWTQKKYLSVPFRLYCTVMYYVTILNVKESLRQNTTEVSTWLRKFNRDYDRKGLPLPGYLLPQYASLSAYQVPDDDRQTWTYPNLPNNLGTRMTSASEGDEVYRLTQPDPSILFDIMKFYASGSPMTTAANRVNDQVVFFPTTGATHFGGRDFEATYTRHNATSLANPAINAAFPESFLSMQDRRRVWQASIFSDLSPVGTYGAHGTAAHDFSSIHKFLRLDQTMLWFNECVAMAKIHCSFFEHSTFFSSLDYVAGPETNIFSDVQLFIDPEASTTATPVALADNLLPDLRTVHWYPRVSSQAHANLIEYEDGINLMCYLVAKHCLSNSRITFRFRGRNAMNTADATHTVAALSQASSGTDDPVLRAYLNRAGPWYNISARGAPNADGPLTNIWKRSDNFQTEVLSGREDYIRSHYYKSDVTF